MIAINKEKKTFGLLCLLPFLAFLSLCFYSYPIVSRLLLLVESGVFFLLLVLNWRLVGKWYKWAIIAANLASLAYTLLYHSGIGIALAFFNLLVALFIFNNLSLEKNEKRFLHFLSAALLLLFYFASNFGKIYGMITMRDFRGWFLNPNVVGMLLLALLFHAFNYVAGLEIDKNKKYLWLCAIVAVLGYLIYFSGCRSAIISLVAFLALLAIARLYKKPIPYGYYKAAALLILIASIAFTVVYVYLSYHLSDLTILNKKLFTGREIVWQSAYGLISEQPFFGNGTDVLLETVGGNQTTSAHNMLLSFWYTIGVIPTVTVALFFINRTRKTEGENRDRITQLALIASLVICFFESFYADPNLQIFFVMFLLSNVKNNDKVEIK